MKSVDPESNPSADAIRRAIAAVPRGTVSSYGAIARRAGLPGRARLVARILAQTADDAGLPWHRIVRADGRIAFAAGTRGQREQARRLAAEGVRCRNGRVDRGKLVEGADDLDAILWGP